MFEQNPADQYRSHFKKVLQELKQDSFCQTCKGYIFKYVYSARGQNMICCSFECVDNYDANINYYDE